MMTLLSGLWGKVAGIALAVAGVLAVLATAYSKGKAAERAKQTARNLEAAEDRLEMDREATEAEREVGALSEAEARKEAERWSRP